MQCALSLFTTPQAPTLYPLRQAYAQLPAHSSPRHGEAQGPPQHPTVPYRTADTAVGPASRAPTQPQPTSIIPNSKLVAALQHPPNSLLSAITCSTGPLLYLPHILTVRTCATPYAVCPSCPFPVQKRSINRREVSHRDPATRLPVLHCTARRLGSETSPPMKRTRQASLRKPAGGRSNKINTARPNPNRDALSPKDGVHSPPPAFRPPQTAHRHGHGLRPLSPHPTSATRVTHLPHTRCLLPTLLHQANNINAAAYKIHVLLVSESPHIAYSPPFVLSVLSERPSPANSQPLTARRQTRRPRWRRSAPSSS